VAVDDGSFGRFAVASAQEAHPRPASDFLDPRAGVTEEELVTRALASNPTLLAERQQIAMAKGGRNAGSSPAKPVADSWWTERSEWRR